MDCPKSRIPFTASVDMLKRTLGTDLPPIPQPLYTSVSVWERTMDVRFVLAAIGLYLAVIMATNGVNRKDFTKRRGARIAVIAHNLALCIYSAWTSSVIWPHVWRSFISERGDSFRASFCGIADGEVEFARGIAPVGYIFYLSKYYEVVDSLILLAKGKRVSTLQLFHHSGAMLTMWAGIRYQAQPIWIFVAFNSFVHALMYCYYTVTALNIRVPRPIKQSLTKIQISQFFLGFSLAASYLFIRLPASFENRRCLRETGQRFAVHLNLAYGVPLICLFLSFFASTYSKPHQHRKTA